MLIFSSTCVAIEKNMYIVNDNKKAITLKPDLFLVGAGALFKEDYQH